MGKSFPGYLLFGVFADHVGPKRTIIVYLIVAAILVPWFAAARRHVMILVTFFGTGFFTGSGILGSELFPNARNRFCTGRGEHLLAAGEAPDRTHLIVFAHPQTRPGAVKYAAQPSRH